MVDGLLVLLGGRGRNKPVSIYDPSTGVWTNREGAGEGILIHHFQCVAAEGKVWIASSWRGKFPREKNNALIYIYDVANDSWSTAKGLPVDRRRGGAAAVKRGDFIYVVGGNRGGHGGHAKTLTWMDAYNYKTDTWTVNLPSMPEGSGRDHTGGALVNDKLCIAGGRDGGQSNFFEANVESTYCYDFETEVWERKQDFPSPRAGAMTGATCDGRMMIAGGEGNGQAYDLVHVFNGSTWEQGPSLVRARHGSGLAVTNCSCGHIFIPSGSGAQAGRPELRSTEQYVPEGASNTCDIY